ncbi:MAG TPA: hypothetical protein VN832_14430 [Stellaceae bacterium]|nr:hypothetical protein [Stellaceae bacterium]
MRRIPFPANIIVSNLPDGFSGGDLASLFDDYGLVLGAMISRPRGEAGAPRGMVNLAPPKAVERAISSLDGKVVESRHLRVRRAPEPPVRAKPKLPAAPRPGMTGTPRFSSEERAAAFPVAPPRPSRAVVVERRPLRRTSRPQTEDDQPR